MRKLWEGVIRYVGELHNTNYCKYAIVEDKMCEIQSSGDKKGDIQGRKGGGKSRRH